MTRPAFLQTMNEATYFYLLAHGIQLYLKLEIVGPIIRVWDLGKATFVDESCIATGTPSNPKGFNGCGAIN